MHKDILLDRFFSNDVCTLGNLYVDGEHVCYTLEQEPNDNAFQNSCIPEGCYEVVFREDKNSKYKYKHLHVLDVPDRSLILFHIGNYPKDTLGCILPGMNFSRSGSYVTKSKDAFDLLMSKLEGATTMNLTVKWES